MKKSLLILFALLIGVSGSMYAEDVKYYTPTNRVTTFASDKKYMIYNTCIDGNQDRTGFIYVDGDGNMKKYTGSTDRNPKQFRTTNDAYLWKVVTGADNQVSIQNVSNSKYYGYNLSSNASDPGNLYLYQWGELTSGQAKANSQNEDDPSTKTLNANITFATNKVFVIGNKDAEGDNKQFWNGNVGDIVQWGNGHPFAFYEIEEVTVPVEVPSGYNAYVDTKTIGTTEWKTESNWVLTDTWNSNGPGCNGSEMWSPIYLEDVTATGIAFEGWNLRLKLVNSSLTATTNKLQAGGTVTIDVDKNSTLNLTFSTSNGNPGLHTFNIDGNLTINMGSYNWNGGSATSTNNINLGTTGNFTFTASAAKTIPTSASFAINATLTDPTTPNTVESRTLATFTNVTVSSLSPTISGTDGWTSVANKAALDEQTADGKYYYVEQNPSGVTLNTYQFQVASKKQQAKDKVSPYEDYIGTGVGKYTVYLGETAYSTYSAFETAVDGWTTIGACVEPTIAINQPTAGFYRFKAAARSADDNTNNWYMGGNASSIYPASTTAAKASDANTIFYVEKDGDVYHFINYVSGLYSNGTANNEVGTKSNFTFDKAIKENNTDVLYGEYKLVNTGTNKVIVMWNNDYLNAINGNNDWSGWTIEPVDYLPVTVSAAGYATFCFPVNVTFDGGGNANAYIATSATDESIHFEEPEAFKAGQGILVKGAAGNYTFAVEGEGNDAEDLLGGTTAAINVSSLSVPDGSTLCAFQQISGGTSYGFYSYPGSTFPGFKAYYIYTPSAATSNNFLTLSFGEDDDPTAVQSVVDSKNVGNAQVFDLQGRKVKNPQKGNIYIQNGKTILY